MPRWQLRLMGDAPGSSLVDTSPERHLPGFRASTKGADLYQVSSRASHHWFDTLVTGLLVLLWLFIAALVGEDSAIGGIAVLVAGVIYFAIEIWIARNGDRYEGLVVAWRLIWRLGLAAIVAGLAVTTSDSTLGMVVGVAMGCLIAAPPFVITAFWLLARHRPAPPES
jgi:hypothetical protein